MSPQRFGIEEIAKGFHLDGVLYRGKLKSFDFMSEPLPECTSSEHVRLAKKAGVHDYRAASAPHVYSICAALSKNKAGKYKALVEKARKSLCDILGSDANFILALSQVVYSPKGLDTAVHDVGLETSWRKKAHLVGSDGHITAAETSAREYVQALLDTNDSVKEVNAVFKWITARDSYAYRLNEPQDSEETRVVGLGVGSNFWFILDANDIVDDDGPALGVRRAKKIIE